MNDLTTRVAKLLWAKLPAPQMASDEIDEAARAVVALVLGEAAKVACSHDRIIMSTNLADIRALQIAAAIRALGVQS